MIQFSISLRNFMLSTGALSAALNGGKILIFGGPVPATADEATPNATLLCALTNNGDGATGLQFDSAANGILPAASAQQWKCLAANIIAGTATYYRFCVGSDDGLAAVNSVSSSYRVQGTIGADSSYDLTVGYAVLSSSAAFGPLTAYELTLKSVA